MAIEVKQMKIKSQVSSNTSKVNKRDEGDHGDNQMQQEKLMKDYQRLFSRLNTSIRER
ncbi:MAG: hypothetical protein ACI8WB_001345 [Phenylobacterium sp.]|jgi:hypothetical protein